MEPRHSWHRNRAIAEEFCYYDEQVRIAETVLAQAQTARRHALAAFAVNLGRDRSAADLLGLAEREVRAARRSVGRKDARIVAEELLTSFHERAEKERAAESADRPDGSGGYASSGPPALSALDEALAQGWRSGVDLHVLAAEAGVEVSTVVDRLKKLSTQGLLPDPEGPTAPRGRHRRTGDSAHFPRASPQGTRSDEGFLAAHVPPDADPGQRGGQIPEEADAGVSPDPWAAWETEFSVPAPSPPPPPDIEAEPARDRRLITVVMPRS